MAWMLSLTSAVSESAQQALLLAAWTRLESAKALHELTQREAYQFWREEFARGLACSYDGADEELVRVFSDSPGINIAINRDCVINHALLPHPGGTKKVAIAMSSKAERYCVQWSSASPT
jgi:hypothetical protein